MKKSELKQIIKEEISKSLNEANVTISEAMTPKAAQFIGYNYGPNRREKIDQNSPEAVYIKNIADSLYNTGYPISKLEGDEIISAFVEGVVDSTGSSQATFQYKQNPLLTTIKVLINLAVKNWPK